MSRRLHYFLALCPITILMLTHQPAFAGFGFNYIIRIIQPQKLAFVPTSSPNESRNDSTNGHTTVNTEEQERLKEVKALIPQMVNILGIYNNGVGVENSDMERTLSFGDRGITEVVAYTAEGKKLGASLPTATVAAIGMVYQQQGGNISSWASYNSLMNNIANHEEEVKKYESIIPKEEINKLKTLLEDKSSYCKTHTYTEGSNGKCEAAHLRAGQNGYR